MGSSSSAASAAGTPADDGDSELESALLREPEAPAFRTVVPHTPAVLRAREHLTRSAAGTPLHGGRRGHRTPAGARAAPRTPGATRDSE